MKLLIIFLIWPMMSFAEDFIEEEEIRGPYSITWGREDELYITRFKKGDETLNTWEGGYVSDRFLRFGEYQNFLTIIWRRGVHGERILVFNKNEDKILWEFSSNWPIDIQEKKDKIIVSYYDEIDGKNVSLTKNFSFSPKKEN